MGKRYVDADILDDLSRHARRTRDDLADLLHKCEGRVKILPQRGWSLGTWGDVFNSVKNEATSLDDHARELVDRAARVREAARERVLQELRELWAAIAGLRKKIEGEAAWLKKFWGDLKSRAKSAMSQLLVLAILAKLPPHVAVGVVVVALSKRWIEALHRLEEERKAKEAAADKRLQQQAEERRKREEARKKEAEAAAAFEKQQDEAAARQKKTVEIRAWENEHKGTVYQCVRMVQLFTGVGSFYSDDGNPAHGNAWDEWNIHQKSPNAFKGWQQIPASSVQRYEPGDVIFFYDGSDRLDRPEFADKGYKPRWAVPEGHVGIVVEVKDDGTLVIMDSNHYVGQDASGNAIMRGPGEFTISPGDPTILGVMRR